MESRRGLHLWFETKQVTIMKTNFIAFIFSTLTLMACAQAQPILVAGQITDHQTQQPLPGVVVTVKGTSLGTTTNATGQYQLQTTVGATLVFSYVGYLTTERKVGKNRRLDVLLKADSRVLHEVVVTGHSKMYVPQTDLYALPTVPMMAKNEVMTEQEEYAPLSENGFKDTHKDPLTTFSIDVDRAAYSNVRRMLNLGQMPPKDAVRIEEMVNYFDYNYAQPTDGHPVRIQTELSESPWNKGLQLLHIGLQAKTIAANNLPASNLVFLIDVSGSMEAPNKLSLVKSAFKLLIDQLRPTDCVAVVVYAGAAGTVLPSTAGSQKTTLKDALDKLEAGGSTAGGAGIELAYKIAQENFIKNGNNRVILATDGDFNVGVSSQESLQQLVENKRKSGVFLSVLGFGMGNYKDSKMETLADKGNGNYAYIDNLQEAQKVFVKEFGGTLFTVAKDVKLQLEFNPKFVKGYRLIGYENRALNNEDFNNDQKDAGEMGSGHSVTALYEIIPVGVESAYLTKIDPLKYQKNAPAHVLAPSDEMLTVKLRYKQPDALTSQRIEVAVRPAPRPSTQTSDDFRLAAAVAEFGLLLRQSEFRGAASYQQALQLVQSTIGKDPEGYRAELMRLIKLAEAIDKPNAVAGKD